MAAFFWGGAKMANLFTGAYRETDDFGVITKLGGERVLAEIDGASFFRSFEMPFGGYKHSGIGTEGVLSTFNEMTHTKTIVLKNIL